MTLRANSAPPISPASADIIDPALRAALSGPDAGPLQFVVEFATPSGQRADLEAASRKEDWAEQGAQVAAVLQHSASQAQSAARALLTQRGTAYRPLWIVNALAVEGAWGDVLALAGQPNVTRIRLPRRYPLHTPTAAQPFVLPGGELVGELAEPPAAEEGDKPVEPRVERPANAPAQADGGGEPLPAWGVSKIRADRVWQELGVRGEGIVIGSIDTGVRYTHEALTRQYRGWLGNGRFIHHYNWFDPNGETTPFDNNGHGTHTVGTMLGDDGGDYQIGVAPRATWIAAKGCANDWCSDIDLALSGQWMLAPTRLDGSQPDPARRPHIINNSWGANAWDPFYQAIVSAWRAAGIYPVFSIGNAGPGCGTAGSPGTYASVLGVGATTSGDQIAAFSSRGPSRDPATPSAIKPDLSAPGQNVLSALAGDDNEYGTLSGTSMAAPHAAGAVALIWSANPSLIGQIVSTTQILTSTAQPIVNTVNCGEGVGKVPNNTHGWGRLDAYSATLKAIESGPASGALALRIVISPSGQPAQAVLAQLNLSPAQTLHSLSDANGEARLRAPAGSYTLTAQHPDFRPAQLSITITAGVTTSAVITVSPRARWTLSGTVRDAQNGLPVRATLRATSPDLPEDRTAQAEPASGAYTLSVLGGVSLSIQVEALGYVMTQTALFVPDEEDGAGNILYQDFSMVSHDCLVHPAACSRLALHPLGNMGWPPARWIEWLAINGDIAYVAQGERLFAVDIGQPDAMRILSVTPIAWQPAQTWAQSEAVVTGDRLIVLRMSTDGYGYALHLISLQNPLAPRLMSVVTQNSAANGRLFAHRGYVYVPEANAGWRVYSTTETSLAPIALAQGPLFTRPVFRVSTMGDAAFAQILDTDNIPIAIAVSLAIPSAPVARDTYRTAEWMMDLWAQDGYLYMIERAGMDVMTLKPIRVSAGLTFTLRPPTTWLTRELIVSLSGWPGHLAAASWDNIELLSLANPDRPTPLSQTQIEALQAGWLAGLVTTPSRVIWHDDLSLYALDTTNRAQPRLLPALTIPAVRITDRRDIVRRGRQVFALSNERLQLFYLDNGVMPRPTNILPEIAPLSQFVVSPDGRRIFYLSYQQPGHVLAAQLDGGRVTAQGSIDLNPNEEIAPLHSLHEHNGVVFAVSEWPTPTLYAVSFGDLQAPSLLARYALPTGAVVIAWAGPRLFITTQPHENSPCQDFRLTTVLLDNPAAPALGGSTPTYACLSPRAGIAHNGWLYTQDGAEQGALRVFSVSDPLAPQLVLTTTLAAHPQAAIGERLFTWSSKQDSSLAAHALLDPGAPIRIPISPTLPDVFNRITWIEGDFVWHDLAQTATTTEAVLYGISVSTEARPGQPWRLESVGERNGMAHTRIDIPAGAWSDFTAITYTPGLPFGDAGAEQPGLAHIGRVFTLTADTPPQLPLTLTLTYSDDDLGAVPEATLRLYRWDADAGGWRPQTGQEIDREANRIVAPVSAPGVFALLGAPYRAYAPMLTYDRPAGERPIACHNLAANGGFESGPPGIPWQISAAPNDPLIYQSAKYSGAWGAWLGARVNYTDTLWQRIELPREATTATLTLWWRMSTNETTTRTVYDLARFGLRDEAGAWVSPPITVSNLSARNTWTAASAVIDVSAQAGRRVQLTLTSSNDFSKTTSWFVDDVALRVCAPQDGWVRPADR